MKKSPKRVMVGLEVHSVDGEDKRKLVLGPIALFDDGVEVRSCSIETLVNVIYEEDAVIMPLPRYFDPENVVPLPVTMQKKLERLLALRMAEEMEDAVLEVGEDVIKLIDSIRERSRLAR